MHFLLDQPFLHIKIQKSQRKSFMKKNWVPPKNKCILTLKGLISTNFEHFKKKISSACVQIKNLNIDLRKIFVAAYFPKITKNVTFRHIFT